MGLFDDIGHFFTSPTFTQDILPGVLTFGLYSTAKAGYNMLTGPAQRAAKAQKDLESQRSYELTAAASARSAAADAAASRGQNFGTRSALLGAFGFGSGNSRTGIGLGNLYGR